MGSNPTLSAIIHGGLPKRLKGSVLKTERSLTAARGFKSLILRHVAVAQLAEHQVVALNVMDSSSIGHPTNIGRCGMNTDAVAGRSGGARTR